MEKNQYSDLPKKECISNIIIVKPRLTGIGIRGVPINSNRENLERLFNMCVEFNSFQHLGTTNFPGQGRFSPPEFCGGELIWQYASFATQKLIKNQSHRYLACSNPNCGLELYTTLGPIEIKSIMIHLMMKQINPHHPSCNFNFVYNHHMKEVRQLGTVSLTNDLFKRFVPVGGTSSTSIIKGSVWLGFILALKMNTLEPNPDYALWSKFLLEKYQEFAKESISFHQKLILGPKPLR